MMLSSASIFFVTESRAYLCSKRHQSNKEVYLLSSAYKFIALTLLSCSNAVFADSSHVYSPFNDSLKTKNVNLAFTEHGELAAARVKQENLKADELKYMADKEWTGAMTEVGIILLLGRISYMAGGETIERDFDYELEGNEFEYFHDRLFTKEYLKLDDNSKGMNWGHAYAGMIYHQSFRNHNFSYYESVMATFLTSTAWETLFEYKEVVSINDQFFTTWGGAVLGESFFQIGEMLEYKEGWIPATFKTLFNPAKAIRGWLGVPSKGEFTRNNTEDVFSVYGGLLYSSNDTRDLDVGMLHFGVSASVNSMEDRYSNSSNTPNLVEVDADFGFSQKGFEDFHLSSTVLLGGYHRSSRNADSAWENTFFIGPSVGIEYASFSEDEDQEDFFASVNLLGVSLGSDWHKERLSFAFRAKAYGDFAMVRPFASKAIENYRDFYWNSKSALRENAYAYALGHTIDLQFKMKYDRISIGLSARSQRWDSIDNKEFERSSSWNPNNRDLDFKDARDRFSLFANVDITADLSVGIRYEEIHRRGEFFGIDNPGFYATADDIERRGSVQLIVNY